MRAKWAWQRIMIETKLGGSVGGFVWLAGWLPAGNQFSIHRIFMQKKRHLGIFWLRFRRRGKGGGGGDGDGGQR